MTGIARHLGSVPNDPAGIWSVIEQGDVELFRVDPPLAGHHIVAATTQIYAVHARLIGDDRPGEDPVSTTFYGVSGGEAAHIERGRPLADTADGMTPARALAELGYAVR